MLRLSRPHKTALPKLINEVRRTPAYLRHAPPSLYVTCDFEKAARHTTLLVDASVEGEPPLTNGAYVLASTEGDDLDFRKAQSVLVGLPFAQDASQASRFVDAVLRPALTRSGMAIPFDGIQTIILPEPHPFAAHTVKEILSRLPQVRFACSSLMAAFLSDTDFFSGVRKSLCENDAHLPAKLITFADVPQANLQPLEDGAVVPVSGECRKLLVATGDLSRARERWRRERRNKLKHFESYTLFLYDPAFCAMLAPPSAGVHFDWMPFVVHEADANALLPLPDFFSIQKSGGSSLMEVWRLREQVHRVTTALEKFPETQRVLTACYGEVSGGADGYLERLQLTVKKLEELRSRLGHRLVTDTVRDMERWSTVMEEKVLKEVVFTNTADKTTSDVVLAEYRRWASTAYLGRLSRALVHAAATLPPDALPEPAKKASSSLAAKKDVEGAAGVQLLKRHFEGRGMASLAPVLEREEIDVAVFLAMSPEDCKKVFRATFGVVKKMELLQQELRASH
ncbi:putative serine peptidase [Trypanosoma rangeli]|uniref:Putative serine peptidase n=1 Tax=Trypanosoma rangeli TaxID=5698 RepID=A0A3R7LKS4_TRYRA|nr:putative serine peptidase [Trypanosoma rangeli]RNE99168.1 putative serine peptidase [Trypanosoma rangeli]|eukprot:RNE99168.1 putative serine peptidase [Trypanosoma rangeli]